jgi:cation transport ATPase
LTHFFQVNLDILKSLLDRPAAERVREFKYRFAQSFVFGLPVLALHWFGHRLGGFEADRWIGLLQFLLAGWVMYVAMAGMLFEGLLYLARRKLSSNLLVSLIAAMLYCFSAVSWGAILLGHHPWPMNPRFDLAVLFIVIWTGVQWFRFARAAS